MAEIDRENVIGSFEVRIISDTDAGYSTIEIPVNEAERILALLKDQDSPAPVVNDHSDPVTIITAALVCSNGKAAYDTGFRNGIRYCRAILTDKDPEYEEVRRGKWIPDDHEIYSPNHDVWECSICHHTQILIEGTPVESNYNYCPACGTRLD